MRRKLQKYWQVHQRMFYRQLKVKQKYQKKDRKKTENYWWSKISKNKLLDNEPKQPSEFSTKSWVEINDSRGTNTQGSQI